MKTPDRPAPPRKTFGVRCGDFEFLVTSPSGRVEFMGLWEFIKFVWQATRAGHRLEVRDD